MTVDGLPAERLEIAIRQGVDDYLHSTSEFYLSQKGEDAWRSGLTKYVAVRIGWAVDEHRAASNEVRVDVDDRLIKAATVRRDGNRIRRGNGAGYGDMVGNAVITEHLLRALDQCDYEHVVFAAAVLDLRRREAGELRD